MQTVSIERRESVAIITIDNPPVNALSQTVRQGLIDCVELAEQDDSVTGIVLACAGRTFIAGADIREFDKPPEAPHLPDVVHRLEAAKKPLVAAIHGTALGGGLEVAMGCHQRVAADDASLGLPEVKLGLLPGATGTQRLPRLVGAETALDMMLGGAPVSADHAHQSGLVDAVAERAALLDAACAMAKSAADETPRRVRDLPQPAATATLFAKTRQKIARRTRGLISPEYIVRCVEAAANLPYEDAVRFERESFATCKASPQSAGLRHAFFAERQAAKTAGIGNATQARDIDSVAVIGAGTMGAGIAFACLRAGLSVYLVDIDDAALERGQKTIEDLFRQGIDRGKLDDGQMLDGMRRLALSVQYDEIADVDLVIEAVFENMDLKKQIFSALDATCRPGTILATNTSTLDVDAIAGATSRPRDVIGLHFFSPAHIMRLLEIVRGSATSAEVISSSMRLAKRLQKVGVVVGNCFGFVGNRMLYCYGRENQLLLLEGALPADIDRALTAWGMAMGPNAVGDLAGLDVGYKARQERSDLPDDPRFYRVADMLAERGWFGQKTGRGMYRYTDGSRTPEPDPEVHAMIRAEADRLDVAQRTIGAEEIVERCIYALILEGARILEEKVAARSGDIDVIWTNGYGFPRYRGGPMHVGDVTGARIVRDKVTEFAAAFGADYWQVPSLLDALANENGRFADHRDC